MNEITVEDAWREIFSLGNGNRWVPIPKNLKRIVGLDSRMGISGGLLTTKHSAQYAERFINRLN